MSKLDVLAMIQADVIRWIGEAAVDPTLPAWAAITAEIDARINTHVGLPDPHSQYATDADLTAAFATRILTAGAGLSGGGDLSADRSFAVGAGTGISVGADDVGVDTSYGFAWGASHTFNEGLAVADTKAITFGGDVSLSRSAPNTLYLSADDGFQSADFALDSDGFQLGGDGAAFFRYLYAAELHAKAFVADLEQALAGGQFICKSVAPLTAAFTAPAAGGTADLSVEEYQGFGSFDVFVTGDFIRLRSFSRAGTTLTIADCWGTVGAATHNADNTQTYTFTRAAGVIGAGNAPGDMAAATVVPIGSLALDYGQSGNGYIESVAQSGAMATGTPYIKIGTWVTSPGVTANNTERVKLGNMRGSFGVGANDYYGFGAGDYAGGNYLKYDSNGGFELKAGGGAVTIDDAGITLLEGSSKANSIEWVDAGDKIGAIYSGYSAGSPYLELDAYAYTAGDDIYVNLIAQSSEGPVSAMLQLKTRANDSAYAKLGYYVDGADNFWIDPTGLTLGIGTLRANHANSLVNQLVNGGFEIWQRGTSFAALSNSAGAFSADRWYTRSPNAGTFTVTQETGTKQTDSQFSLKVVATSVVASEGYIRQQRNTDTDAYQLRGRTVSLSMWVWCNTATAARLCIVNSGGTLTYGDYHAGDSAWAKLTLENVTILSSGDWWLGLAISANCTAYLDNASMVIGVKAQDYMPLLPADDLLRCQRYYEKSYDPEIAPGTATSTGEVVGQASNAVGASIAGTLIAPVHDQFRVTKAVTPTVTIYSTDGTANAILVAGVSTRTGVTASGPCKKKPIDALAISNASGVAILDRGQIQYHWVAEANP